MNCQARGRNVDVGGREEWVRPAVAQRRGVGGLVTYLKSENSKFIPLCYNLPKQNIRHLVVEVLKMGIFCNYVGGKKLIGKEAL